MTPRSIYYEEEKYQRDITPGAIDLHIHSSFSDGTFTPKEIFNELHESNVNFAAITDHEEIKGSVELKKLAKDRQINIITGCEIEVSYDYIVQEVYEGIDHQMLKNITSRKMHILAYNFLTTNAAKELKMILKMSKDYRRERNLVLIKQLEKRNIFITIDELIKKAGSEVNVGKPHFVAIMKEKGVAIDEEVLYKNYLDDSKIVLKNKRPKLEDVIEAIHKAGGIVVLAHPCQLRSRENETIPEAVEKIESIIKHLKDRKIALDGIETYHSEMSDEWIRYVGIIAKKYDLIETIGSDFHGLEVKRNIFLASGENRNIEWTSYNEACLLKNKIDARSKMYQ